MFSTGLKKYVSAIKQYVQLRQPRQTSLMSWRHEEREKMSQSVESAGWEGHENLHQTTSTG